MMFNYSIFFCFFFAYDLPVGPRIPGNPSRPEGPARPVGPGLPISPLKPGFPAKPKHMICKIIEQPQLMVMNDSKFRAIFFIYSDCSYL